MRCGLPSLRPVPRMPVETGALSAVCAAGVSAAGPDATRWKERTDVPAANVEGLG